MNIDWNEAPEWAVAHGLHETGFGIKEFWLGETQHQNLEHAKSFPYGGGDPSCGSFHNSRRESFSYVTQRPAPWTGEGLPPVGTVCEYDARPVGKGEPLWVTVKVNYLSEWTIVFECVAVPEGAKQESIGVELAVSADASTARRFRPLHTPEQIAAESLYDRVLSALRDDDQIREPGRIAKLVVAAISDVKAAP